MNSIKHAQISARRRGGVAEDYIDIHQFIDSTKNLCSDNRHRIFHTLWAVNEIVLPIFGHQIINSDGNMIDVKDLCEKDHLLVDYRHRFIPTLSDFVQAMDVDITPSQRQVIERVHTFYSTQYSDNKDAKYGIDISRLLLSPLALTGQLKSLLITHNSWFLLSVLPRYIEALMQQNSDANAVAIANPLPPELLTQDFELSGDVIFKHMSFKGWMNHGVEYPPSAQAVKKLHINIE